MTKVTFPDLESTARMVFHEHVASLFDGSSRSLLGQSRVLPEADWMYDIRYLANDPIRLTFVSLLANSKKIRAEKTAHYETGALGFYHQWKIRRTLYLKLPLGNSPAQAYRDAFFHWSSLSLAIASVKDTIEDHGIYRLAVTPNPVARTESVHTVLIGNLDMTLTFFALTEIHSA